jgi:tripartite-type tricarboxylate transporter receptor subunit TctC
MEIFMKMLSKLIAPTICACASLFSTIASSESYPDRAIKLIVPWPAGGASDLVARALSEGMRKDLGQSIVVENKAGATGRIGIDIARKAPADGYTLVLAISNTHGVAPALYPNLPYDPIKDFTPVGVAAIGPLALTVSSSLPFKTLPELIAYAKKNPGKLNFGSAGAGSGSHLMGEMFKSMAGIDIVHVPYKGTAPAVNDLAAGHVHLIFEGSAVKSFVEDGKLRVLATTAPKRWSLYPESPTTAELGLPKLMTASWFGIMGPKGMPKPVVDRLSRSLLVALKDPSVQAALKGQGFDVATAATPDDMSTFIASEIDRWKSNLKLINYTHKVD